MSVDPLAEKYPGWSPYAYTLNNPVKLVDRDGMEAEEIKGDYYDNKGKYIGTDGIDDGRIYIINTQSIKDFQSMSCDALQSNSIEVEISSAKNKEKVLVNWALKYQGLSSRYSNNPKGDREFAMSLFSGEINTENGTNEVFVEGNTVKGRKGVDGVSLFDSKSPIEGWKATETIHTHRWGSSGNFSNSRGYLGDDVSYAVKTGNPLYLVAPYAQYIGKFNPKAYTKYINNGRSYKKAQKYSTNKNAIKIR